VRGVFDIRLPREHRNRQVVDDLLRAFHIKFPEQAGEGQA
jgi:NitT/TauT family transport system ATP-binding protein